MKNSPVTIRRVYEPQTWDTGTVNNEPSMVQPEHAAETEINNVMARYARTGQIPLRDVAGVYADLSVDFDFAAAQDVILEANRRFLTLPFEVRDEFRTPQGFLEAFNSKSGLARLEAVGVLQKAPKKEPEAPSAQVAGSGVQPQNASEGKPAS